MYCNVELTTQCKFYFFDDPPRWFSVGSVNYSTLYVAFTVGSSAQFDNRCGNILQIC